MYPNHNILLEMARLRMEEDQRNAENERFVHPNKARLDLMVWRERVREVLENIDSVGKDMNRDKSSLPDST